MDDEELLGIKKKKLGTNVLQELRKLAEIAETMKKQTPHTKTAEAEKNATLARLLRSTLKSGKPWRVTFQQCRQLNTSLSPDMGRVSSRRRICSV